MIAAGARCPTHEGELALGACERCGTFFCALCPAPHCGPTRDFELERRIANFAMASWGVPLASLLLCLVPIVNLLVLPFLVAGLSCGLRARMLAKQAGLPTPLGAVIGIVLTTVMLALAVISLGAVLRFGRDLD